MSLYNIQEIESMSSNEKIKYRRQIFDQLYKKKEKLNENLFDDIEKILTYCPSTVPKYEIPFVKKAIEYLKQSDERLKLERYYEILVKLPLSDVTSRNDSFSEKDLAILNLFKCYCNNNDVEKRDKLYFDTKDIVNKKTRFYIEYNLCKSYFEIRDYENAVELYKKLIKSTRELYVLILPVKYYDEKFDYPDLELIIAEIILTRVKKEKVYIYKYIYNWIRTLESRELFDKIKNFVSFKEDFSMIVNNIESFNHQLIEHIEESNNERIFVGEIYKIFGSRNGIVKNYQDNETYYVDKKYLTGFTINSKVKFFFVEIYKNEKIVKNAIILGGLNSGKK